MFFVSRGLIRSAPTNPAGLAASVLEVDPPAHPAVDRDGDARQKGRPVRGQEAHQVGDLFGQRDAPERIIPVLLLDEALEILTGRGGLLALEAVPAVRFDGAR